MADRMSYKGISLDLEYLEERLKTKIALVSTRKNQGIDTLKTLITNYKELSIEHCIDLSVIDKDYFDNLKKAFPNQLLYKLWLVITQDVNFGKTDRKEIDAVAKAVTAAPTRVKDVIYPSSSTVLSTSSILVSISSFSYS